ncbi:molybdopterin synthase sulfur carrier subunit isoform X2 [Periophthalmus magnuspinnatus]|uniref:molybdopterin synthase sulfur carrier subunit isoform X2 n=1 Tax=Periophthalmus magnuspinnatus TaxID=409849 RepID=UPI00145A876A|nr:molybdopterin synthase sulfur carrier subunit isoform X2 [Periophthalmus magnuspinnatus]
MSQAQVKVLYFARSADLTGLREEPVSVATPISGRGLWVELQRRHPSLSALQGALVLAVRQEFVAVDDDQPLLLGDGDEVAVVPPLSGG